MTYCSKDDPQYKVTLYYVSVVLGLLVTLCAGVSFGYKWCYIMGEEDKLKFMPRLSGIIIVSCFIERSIRIIEIYLLYHEKRFYADICYYINGIMIINVGYLCIQLLLLLKLLHSFENSLFEISNNLRKLLYSLITIDLVIRTLFFIVAIIPEFYQTTIGRVLLLLIGFIQMINTLFILIQVDYNFVSKLRLLVAESMAESSPAETLQNSFPSHTMNVPSTDQLNKMNSLSKHVSNMSGSISTTIYELRNSHMSDFDLTHQQFLKTGAKSTLIAIMISLSILVVIIGCGSLLIIGHCGDWATISAHAIWALSYLILCSAMILGLKESQSEYEYCCSHSDRLLQQFVACQTNRNVVELTQQKSQTNRKLNKTSLA